jgi:parallel beta-helix repeat protein
MSEVEVDTHEDGVVSGVDDATNEAAYNLHDSNITGNTSNSPNETLLEKSITENNSAEVMIPFLTNNTFKNYINTTGFKVYNLNLNIDDNVDSWAKTYGSDKTNEGINSIQQTGDGYVVAGWVGESYFGNKDIWVAKLDINGSIEWQKSYGESESEEAYSIQSVNDGYIVAGYKSSGNNKDVWILKLDERGKIEWQKVFDWGDKDIAYSIKQTEDGSYIVIGETGFWRSEGKTESGIETRVLDSDVWILKLDKNGNIEWQKAYGGEYTDRAYSISEADHGYVFVRYMGDSVFCEVSKDGDILRQKAYVAWNYGDVVYSIQQTDDGYILAGWTNSYGAGKNDVWVIKVNNFGSLKWQKSYGGSEDDKAYSILPTGDGYIFAGTTKSFGNGGLDAWVIKLDKEGNTQWQKSYGGSKDDEIRSILATEDGYIISGYTGSFGSGNGDAWVLKLDKKGNINNCMMVKETNAVVNSTSARSSSWSLKTKNTNTKGAITSAEAINTNFKVQTICPYVKPVFPVHSIYVPDNYSTIQEAVNAASPGNTIVVRDGVYTENINVDKPHLTIRSENGSDSTVVQAATSNSDVFKVSTDYVNINWFTVKGANGCYMEDIEREGPLPISVARFHYCAGIYLKANYCNITNNNCSNNSEGISLYKSNDNIITNNNCSDNRGVGKNLFGTEIKHGYGISLYKSNSNSIVNNTCSSNHDYGIHLDDSNSNTITNNIALNNTECNIYLDSSNNNSILNNNASNNSRGYGIYLKSSNNNNIMNNKISNNGHVDIGDKFTHLIGGGIYLLKSLNNKIYLNDFINNSLNGPFSFNSTNTWNSTEEITYTYNGTTYESYTGNYWDGYKGKDDNNDGIGDAPYAINPFFEGGKLKSYKDNYPLMKKIENYFVENHSTERSPSPNPSFTLSPIPTSSPSPTPTAESLNGTVVLKNGDSYHFLTQKMHKYVSGDFYVSLPSVEKAEFWANNRGQHGLQDLGDIGDMPLDQVSIPEKGYQRFGVEVILGHTYVSLAKEGEEGHYIVFRAIELVAGDHVKLEYLYTS